MRAKCVPKNSDDSLFPFPLAEIIRNTHSTISDYLGTISAQLRNYRHRERNWLKSAFFGTISAHITFLAYLGPVRAIRCYLADKKEMSQS